MRARSAVLGAVLVCALGALAWLYVTRLSIVTPWHHTFDLRVYRGAVQWWLHGRPLYDFLRPGTVKGFTYPPFAAVVLAPLAWGSDTVAITLLTTVSAVLLATITWLLLAPVARRHGWSAVLVAALALPVVVALEPIRETFSWGQVNLVVLALVLVDVVALRRTRRWAGVGIGLATAIKLTPGLFVLYLALSRRRRAAAVAAGTFVAASALAALFDPRSSVRFWTAELWQTDRVGRADRTSNQSVMGLLARLADPGTVDRRLWAVLALAVLVLGLARAARAARRGDELTGITLTGLTSCLASPITWTHHLYWVLPAGVVLLDVAAGTPLGAGAPAWLRARPRAVRRAAAAALAVLVATFVANVPWFFDTGSQDIGPKPLPSPGVTGFLGQNAYVLVTVLLLAFLPVRAPAGADRLSDAAAPSSARTPAPPRPAGSSPR